STALRRVRTGWRVKVCTARVCVLFLSACAPRSTRFPYTTLFRSALRSSKHLRASVTRRRSPDLLLESLTRGVARCPSPAALAPSDRKSTRLNSSHVSISYAVFCLKKKELSTDLGFGEEWVEADDG